MLPVFTAVGARVVAPDLFGFGRSDKPTEEAWYTFTRHREALLAFVRHLDLRHVTLVVQDWGGLLGLTLPMTDPARYERLIVMNTLLATGLKPLGDGFYGWRAWVNANPDFAVGSLLKRACPALTDGEAAAYDAPFPGPEHKAGARRFPNLVCDSPDADGAEISRQALRWWQQDWHGQSFMAIGMKDIVIPPPAMQWLRQQIRGCPPPLEVAEAGHFVQEHGEIVAREALAHFASAPAPGLRP
jgi:pimeloyl-ACP methyl ester carboxylesterase